MINLPNIKTCTFVYTSHTMQKDLVKSYVSWDFALLSKETTMDEHWGVGGESSFGGN